MARDEDQVRGGLVKFGKRVRAATRAMQAQLHAAFAGDGDESEAASSATLVNSRSRGRTVR